MTYRLWPHPLGDPHGARPMRTSRYRVHCPGHHDAREDEGVFSPHAFDDVEDSSHRGAAERWVEERFDALGYPSWVEGLIVCDADVAEEVVDVEVRSTPSFHAFKARGCHG